MNGMAATLSEQVRLPAAPGGVRAGRKFRLELRLLSLNLVR